MFKAIFKGFAIIVAIMASVLFTISEYGIKERNFICTGTETISSQTKPLEFGFRIGLYRWFILWSDSDGNAWVEKPGAMLHYFSHVDNAQSYWAFSGGPDKSLTPPFGQFSTISNTINVGLSNNHVLDGKCSVTPDYR